ncbi:MAG: glycoside hydrolase family 127 protein, partial [Verrucomicrobiales bacterium]|nr:glycoside hydrolase family 127 protein [Verrucomicrobiales bacterium]
VTNRFYVANRPPLAPSPFIKLPIGSITPRGWLRHQLELERNGMTGRLAEISPWLNFQESAWANKDGQGKYGWEEMPYWLKGYGDLGYVLGDTAVITEAKKWIEAAMASQREDGWFGPRELLTGLKGKPDLWPHMVMLNVLQSYHEFSGDPRVLEVMRRYMQWQNALPVSAFGEGYWPRIRAGDNIESVLWLYNRLGEPWLLDLARKIHQGMARWDEDVINWHNVNIAQGFRAGTVAWMVTHDPKHRTSAERNYTKVMDLYGQFAGGGFVGDENCRPGYFDPRGGIETCGIVEFMHSFQMLMKITGDPRWADRCEEIAFNSFPASLTPDLKALHYITSANQVQLDRHNKSPGIQNEGTMFSYSPFEVYRCCQHNVSHGWPYYAEELWLATPDNGLCASLYAASEVSARVGHGTTVTITEETDYPFGDTITLRVRAPETVSFPLYLRVPRWCEKPALKINGRSLRVAARPSSFIRIEREWRDGDTVTLRLPMRLTVRTWAKNKNSVAVDYGPLSFSLAIKERWEKYGNRHPDWPEWEVFPESPWNYGLVLDAKNPARSFRLERRPGPLPPQPFTPDAAPIRLRASARKIPDWRMDERTWVGPLPQRPVASTEPPEEVTLIPMGAARLRMASFPTVVSAARR